MADSHSNPPANGQSEQPEELPSEVFRREVERRSSDSRRPSRRFSCSSERRKMPSSRRCSLSPRPRKLSIVPLPQEIAKDSEQRKPSTTSTSGPKTEPTKTASPKVTPKFSQSSTTPPGKTESPKATTATPRTSHSSSSSPPFDSPTKPTKYTSIDLENDLPDIYR
ncbi:hypothetical protein COOONC_19161 [Cooperia oncophora]